MDARTNPEKFYDLPYWWKWIDNTLQTATNIAISPQVLGDYDFEPVYIMGNATAPTFVTVNLQEGATQKAMMSGAINFNNFVGTAQLPFPIGISAYLIIKNQTLNFTITDTGSGAPNVIQIVCFGFKKVPVGQ
jgi:hypothetical protein